MQMKFCPKICSFNGVFLILFFRMSKNLVLLDDSLSRYLDFALHRSEEASSCMGEEPMIDLTRQGRLTVCERERERENGGREASFHDTCREQATEFT